MRNCSAAGPLSRLAPADPCQLSAMNSEASSSHESSSETCALCREPCAIVGPLQQSHIIPRFILLKSKQRGRTLEFNRGSKQFSVTQSDWKERMMCRACEERLKVYDDTINDVLYLRRRSRVAFERRQHTCVGTSSNRLALALLSVFWRATAATHEAFVWATVPTYMSEEMRSWVLEGRLVPRWHQLVDVRVQRLVLPGGDDVSADFLLRPFIRQGVNFEYVFVCGGYCWTFGIPPLQTRGPNTIPQGTLAPDRLTVRIGKVPFTAVPELAAGMREMLSTPVPPEVQATIDQFIARRPGKIA